jgi:hypothetical protein
MKRAPVGARRPYLTVRSGYFFRYRNIWLIRELATAMPIDVITMVPLNAFVVCPS